VLDWLPISSSANLRYLSVAYTRLARLPAGLSALQTLGVEGCVALADDWLPLCSAANVHTLGADRTNLTRLPEGLHALTKLTCEGCRELLEDCERRN
jgi:hypothetical protein